MYCYADPSFRSFFFNCFVLALLSPLSRKSKCFKMQRVTRHKRRLSFILIIHESFVIIRSELFPETWHNWFCFVSKILQLAFQHEKSLSKYNHCNKIVISNEHVYDRDVCICCYHLRHNILPQLQYLYIFRMSQVILKIVETSFLILRFFIEASV